MFAPEPERDKIGCVAVSGLRGGAEQNRTTETVCEEFWDQQTIETSKPEKSCQSFEWLEGDLPDTTPVTWEGDPINSCSGPQR